MLFEILRYSPNISRSISKSMQMHRRWNSGEFEKWPSPIAMKFGREIDIYIHDERSCNFSRRLSANFEKSIAATTPVLATRGTPFFKETLWIWNVGDHRDIRRVNKYGKLELKVPDFVSIPHRTRFDLTRSSSFFFLLYTWMYLGGGRVKRKLGRFPRYATPTEPNAIVLREVREGGYTRGVLCSGKPSCNIVIILSSSDDKGWTFF